MWLSTLLGSSPAWQWIPSAPFDDFSGSWRTSQEGAWCLVRSDTDNWNRQDSGTRKLFSFQFYSDEVKRGFLQHVRRCLRAGSYKITEYFQFVFVSLGTEGPQTVTGLDPFIVLHYFLTWAKLIIRSKSTEVPCREHRWWDLNRNDTTDYVV